MVGRSNAYMKVIACMMAMTMPTSAVVGMASFVVGALVVGALVVGALVVGASVGAAVGSVGASVGAAVGAAVGSVHVTPFGGAHAPVLRHAGHSVPSVHDGLGSMSQYTRFPTMLQMPDSAPVSWLLYNSLRSVAERARQRRA